MIQIYRRIDTTHLRNWLETCIRQHLTPDVSNYAKGRLRVWLTDEPSLTPDASVKPGPLNLDFRLRARLAELIDWKFDYALATYSGDIAPIGISAHRDARFADYEAVGLNVVGTCAFDYWEGRRSFGKSPNTREFNARIDAPTSSLLLQPGDCVRFNCKNLHRAAPNPRRWNINFWRAGR